MKKLFCFFILILLIFQNKLPYKVSAENSKIFLLGNAECVQVLENSNMYKKVPIASLTKLMTAYICCEKINLGEISFEDKIFASKNASEVEPSKAYLLENNCYLLRDVFEAMLVKSANDCAIAIAEHISGSEQAFSELMNETAVQLGMKSTNYTNASGLATPNQFSTAYDQYILFQEVLKNEDIVNSLKKKSVQFNNGEEDKTLLSTNKLIDLNIIGKTGYTLEAKNCFCGCNIDNDKKFIYIVLGIENSNERFDNVLTSLTNANKNYSKKMLLTTLSKTKKFQLANNLLEYANMQDFGVLVKNGEKCRYNIIERFYYSNKFPINENDIVGESLVLFNNKIIKKVNLVAKNKVSRVTLISNIKRITQN